MNWRTLKLSVGLSFTDLVRSVQKFLLWLAHEELEWRGYVVS